MNSLKFRLSDRWFSNIGNSFPSQNTNMDKILNEWNDGRKKQHGLFSIRIDLTRIKHHDKQTHLPYVGFLILILSYAVRTTPHLYHHLLIETHKKFWLWPMLLINARNIANDNGDDDTLGLGDFSVLFYLYTRVFDVFILLASLCVFFFMFVGNGELTT